MNKIAAVCCYYGKLPNYFYLWLASAKNNSFIDFILVTDQKTVENLSSPPTNLKIIILPFDKLKERIQSLYPFKIVLPSPYKLCDYKFAYGEIFKEELAPYEFFGWYDIDVILGDIKRFIPESALDGDVIGELGHFTLMRSDLFNFYKKSALCANLATPYKKVFKSKNSCYFDELYGLNKLSGEIKKYSLMDSVADIIPYRRDFYVFHRENEGRFVIRYDGKKVYQIFDDGREKETMYVHLQKRKLKIADGVDENGFFITPEGFSNTADYKKDGENDEAYKRNGEKLEREYAEAKRINDRAVFKKKIKNRLRKLFKKA